MILSTLPLHPLSEMKGISVSSCFSSTANISHQVWEDLREKVALQSDKAPRCGWSGVLLGAAYRQVYIGYYHLRQGKEESQIQINFCCNFSEVNEVTLLIALT